MADKLTVKQAAEILEITEPRVLKMLYEGRFGDNISRFGGKSYQLDPEAVERVKQELLQDSRTNVAKSAAKVVRHNRVKIVKHK